MATTHPAGTGRSVLSSPARRAATTRSASEGTAAGMLVVIGAAVVGIGVVVAMWAADAGETIAVLGMLVLLPAAVLQAVIGMVDGVRDHDQVGESRSAAYGLLGVVAVVVCVVAIAVGL
jgi:hypothetical protein